jgi:hypothetical protein
MCPVGISELSFSDFLWFILGCRLRTECFLHLHSQDSIEQSQNDLDDHHLRKCQYHMAASKPCRTLHTSFNRVTQNYLHLQQSTLWGHPILARKFFAVCCKWFSLSLLDSGMPLQNFRTQMNMNNLQRRRQYQKSQSNTTTWQLIIYCTSTPINVSNVQMGKSDKPCRKRRTLHPRPSMEAPPKLLSNSSLSIGS